MSRTKSILDAGNVHFLILGAGYYGDIVVYWQNDWINLKAITESSIS